MDKLLSQEQIAEFNDNGIVILKQFYDLDSDINPILEGIHSIVGILIRGNNLPISQTPFTPENFDSGYLDLLKIDRKFGSIIYDAVKQIPAFMRLCGNSRNESVINQVRQTRSSGLAAGGYGIRINNPREDKFRADWHQDYTSQLRSKDGVVFWTPLVNVAKEMGPVRFCIGSHKDGVAKVDVDKKSTYHLKIHDKEKLNAYKVVEPLLSPGDLVLIDFLNIHSSGHNTANRALWSVQFRYFNYNDPTGIKIKWSGSFANGVNFDEVHPEHVNQII